MPTAGQIAAANAFLATPIGGLHTWNRWENGEPVEDVTWNTRLDITEYLLDVLRDTLYAFEARTDNPHGVTLAQVLATDGTTMVPASQIDPTIARKSYVDTRTTGLINGTAYAYDIIDEVVAARGAYLTLKDRLDAMSAGGFSTVVADLFTSDVMIPQEFTGTTAPLSYTVTFTSGTFYDNGVAYPAPAGYAFTPQVSPTTVYLWMQPGGLLVESTSPTPALGALVGTAVVDNQEVISWVPTESVVIDHNLTVTGDIINPTFQQVVADSHRHLRGDCVQTGVPNIFNLPAGFPPTAANIEVYRRGAEQNPISYTLNFGTMTVTLLTGPFSFEPDEWVYLKWTESF